MFKKLKDKITEEVKIPSTKFTQSMQQLAQAVVSPSSNSSNAAFDHASNDNFSIGGDFDDTPQNSPIKSSAHNEGVAYRGGVATPLGVAKDTGAAAGFTLVDLQQESTPQKPLSSGGMGIMNDTFSNLRRSSVSSSTSDSSFMFPILESTGPTYSFQSDLESCSEASESVGPNVNKEQLLQAYQKAQQRYQKYKGRYSDLARHYRELERENSKAKNILAECQDKALRRMSELKEQCLLEKQAKAHLEEALRSDLEEKDHLIHTLETKIKLLKSSADQSLQGEQTSSTSGVSTQGNSETSAEVSPLHSGQEDLLSSGGDSSLSVSVLAPEPAASEIDSALKEKVRKLEVLLLKCREDITSKCEIIKALESDKETASATVLALQEQLAAVKKCEEEASLSLAKNKLTIHRELEVKEDEIKKLHAQLTSAASRITELQEEILQIKEDSQQDLAAGKLEATRLIQAEMQLLITNNQDLEGRLAAKDSDIAAKEDEVAQATQHLKNVQKELSNLKQDIQVKEEKYQQDIVSLKKELSHFHESQNDMNKERIVSQIKLIVESFQELRSSSLDLRNMLVKSLDEAQHFSRLSLEEVIANITNISSKNLQEYDTLIKERDYWKKEFEETREDLNLKLISLKETQAKEKSELACRVSYLEEELSNSKLNLMKVTDELANVQAEAESKISLMKEQICSEKLSEEDTNQKLTNLEQLLNQEREKLQELSALKAEVLNLSQELKAEEQVKEGLVTQMSQMESEISRLVEQSLKGETKHSEQIKQINSLELALSEKDKSLNTLNANLTELEASLKSASSALSVLKTEKQILEQKLTGMSVDLESKTSEQASFAKKMAALEKEISVLLEQQSVYEEKAVEHSIALERNKNLKKEVATLEEKARNLISQNEELSMQLKEKCKQFNEQEAILSSLHNSEEKVHDSLRKVQFEVEKKSSQLTELQTIVKNQQEMLSVSDDVSKKLKSVQAELKTKNEDCIRLQDDLEKLNVSYLDKENSLESKTNECTDTLLQLKKLQLENQEREAEIDRLLQDQLIQSKSLKLKSEECMNLEKRLELLQTEKSEEVSAVHECQSKLKNLEKNLELKTLEVEDLSRKVSSLNENLALESENVKEKTSECIKLAQTLESLSADNCRLTEILRQKVSECEEKESQLDNLADEMKRVEELSHELHRINDDRDANVEVLSSEASSLAQKVEELTLTTQEMKEREVELVAKIQVAEEIQEEFFALKEKEKDLTSKVNQIKSLETEVQVKQEQLLSNSKTIEELQTENKRLKEAGKNLNELVARAKEAEARCVQLQDDGARLFSRIQEVEELEVQCSILRNELVSVKEENSRLQAALELVTESSSGKQTETAGKSKQTSPEVFPGNSFYSKEPVTEELCIKRNAVDLTEENEYNHGEETITDGEKMWENKYNKLLEEHKMAMLKNSQVIEQLREENLLHSNDNDFKSKQRLWDRQDDGTQFGVSIERLQHQLAAATAQLKESKKLHRQEVSDLRRILLNHGSGNSHSVSRSDNLEDATELEYLRNILFEYMMGKEPLVLARVIAAVVKFDSEQTHKVLQKEQQRLSLLGQLGMS